MTEILIVRIMAIFALAALIGLAIVVMALFLTIIFTGSED
jgi:hypothetical protein